MNWDELAPLEKCVHECPLCKGQGTSLSHPGMMSPDTFQMCAMCHGRAMVTDEQFAEFAQVNKAGPFCQLCRHLEMARRSADVRGLNAAYLYIQLAQNHVKRA